MEVLLKRQAPRGKRRAKARQQAKAPQLKAEKRIRAKSIRGLDRIIDDIPGYNPRRDADGCWFDRKRAIAAIRFFQEQLHHVKGPKAGRLFELERWQQAIIANLFGWQRAGGKCPICGQANRPDIRRCGKCDLDLIRRRYRQAFIFVPRKNGKTPMAAGMILYMLDQDGEAGAEIYGAASEYKQAALVFDHARGMVLRDDSLRERYKIYAGQAKAIQRDDGSDDFSTYNVISSEAFSKHGYNTHAYVVDELHTQPNSDLIDTLETSTGARRQPLAIFITTSDYEREGSICNEKYAYACNVRDGVIPDSAFLPVIYEAEKDDDWTDSATWAKANPNLDVSVSREYIAMACKAAQQTPRLENVFKRLHLNLRTEQDVRWFSLERWDNCSGIVDANALKDQECWAGLDLSTTTDISAFCLIFPTAWQKAGEVASIAVLPFFWIPRDNAHERERRDHVPYVEWLKAGMIEGTGHNVIDYDVIRHRIGEIGTQYKIKEIAIDRWNATQLATQLQGDGFDVIGFGQGYASMSAPSKEFERLVLAGALAHGGHPVLRWMASNVAVETDAAGNVKPSKKKSAERIDGIVATIMALGRLMVRTEKKSVYASRGVKIL